MAPQTMALRQRLRRWIDRTAWAICLLMLIALMGALSPALAAKRIDLHDANGRHIGHRDSGPACGPCGLLRSPRATDWMGSREYAQRALSRGFVRGPWSADWVRHRGSRHAAGGLL